jgi:hypothetical protein
VGQRSTADADTLIPIVALTLPELTLRLLWSLPRDGELVLGCTDTDVGPDDVDVIHLHTSLTRMLQRDIIGVSDLNVSMRSRLAESLASVSSARAVTVDPRPTRAEGYTPMWSREQAVARVVQRAE